MLNQKGFHVLLYDYYIRPWNSDAITKYSVYELYGIVGFGHGGYGKGGKLNPSWANAIKGHWKISDGD